MTYTLTISINIRVQYVPIYIQFSIYSEEYLVSLN